MRELSPRLLFRNVSTLLADAIAGRQGDDGAWLDVSPAFEMIHDGWVATEEGLRVRGVGLVAPSKDFGRFGVHNN